MNETELTMISLYVRLRGRVQGPFDFPVLQSMAQRGQLSRIHQVSEDQQGWQKAGEFPEVFVAVNKSNVGTRGQVTTITAKAITDAEADWYFENDREPEGPFRLEEMRQKFSSGELNPDHQVWREGMSTWVAASTVDCLIPIASTVDTGDAKKRGAREFKSSYAHQVVNRLAIARPWIICIAMLTFVVAILVALSGINVVTRGANQEIKSLIGLGCLQFLVAICSAATGFLLIKYAFSIREMENMKTDDNVFLCLDVHKQLVKYIALMLIAVLVASIVLIVFGALVFDDTVLFGQLFRTS